MQLSSIPIHEPACALADWVEFNVLASEYKLYRLSNLTRIADEEQEEENPDIAEQDSINERLLETALSELTMRMNFLDSAYPFRFNEEQNMLLLHDEISKGSYIYLYCLFFSHINREEVLFDDPPSSNADRDIMQICSTYAAAGVVNGNAVSFGFPRADHTGFLQALAETYSDFGEGRVRNEVPPGAPDNEKDARVDIIAWANSLDGAAGRQYMLGQVASGQNWEGKSVKGEIEPFHNTWFEQPPASTPTPAMFIPFCIVPRDQSSLDETLFHLTYKFGDIYYRYRLPKHAEDGLSIAAADDVGDYRIDRVDEFDKIQTYVDSFLITLMEN